MGPAWASAFVAAGCVTLAGTPLLRRLAVATEFVDHPIASHKSHHRPTPYLGGIGLIVGVLIGLLFTDRLTALVGVIALGGSFIGCLGLLDDHRSVGALFRFVVELAVAAVALAAGLRIHATDVPAIDGVLTLVWIVGVTNAVNLMDNMDGLAAGVSAAAATAIFALAILGEQLVTATVAAGVAGACVGFLVHNKRPATIFMGDTGSLFLGFALAATAIEVTPALGPPASFVVPLMLLALPVLDTATVTIARLRHGQSISQGGKDHLSHRLAARGMSPGAAVGVLVATEAAVGLVAFMAGRDVVPLPVAALATAGVLAALASVTVPAEVYTDPVIGMPRRLRQAAAAGVLGIAVLAAPASLALLRAHGPGIHGAAQARAGLDALRAGDAGRAVPLLEDATDNLGRAQHLLGGRLTSLGLLLPGVRANVATTRAVVAAGYDASSAAATLSAVVDAHALALGNGSGAVEGSAALAPALARAAEVLQRSVTTLAGYDRPYLWPSLGDTVRRLRSSLIAASEQAATAADASRLAPALLGASQPQRYFVAIQDNAELRGAGGVMRYWGELTAEAGRLRLSRFGPIEELNASGTVRGLSEPAEFAARYRDFDPANTWQNVNVSPDFSVTGKVVSQLYPQSGGNRVDGVIAVDIPGLAALVGMAGPVQVDGWPAPITGSNLADVVLRDVPRRFSTDSERRAFLTTLYRRALESVLAADKGSPASLAGALGPAVRHGHILLYASDAEREALFRRIGAAGQIPGVSGDSLLVVNQNLSATSVDAALQRRIRYDVRLDPESAPAVLRGRVEITLTNQAAAENRTHLSVYSPFARTGDQPAMTAASELGRQVYSSDMAIPAQESRTLAVDLAGRLELRAGNWYRLDLLHQASLGSDETEVTVSVPEGWRITEVEGGLRVVDDRQAVARLQVSAPEGLAVRVERTAWSRLWARSDLSSATPLAAVEPVRRPRGRRRARPGRPGGPGRGDRG